MQTIRTQVFFDKVIVDKNNKIKYLYDIYVLNPVAHLLMFSQTERLSMSDRRVRSIFKKQNLPRINDNTFNSIFGFLNYKNFRVNVYSSKDQTDRPNRELNSRVNFILSADSTLNMPTFMNHAYAQTKVMCVEEKQQKKVLLGAKYNL